MGLFDTGGFDMEALMRMLSAGGNAGMGGLPSDSAIGNVGTLTPDMLRAAGAGGPTPPLPMPEVNPNPVAPGAVPMPRPNPLQPTPAELAGAVTLNSEPNPMVAAPAPPPPQDGLGAALTGEGVGPTGPVLPGGSTDVSAQARKPGLQEGLAGALRGVGGIKPPELQRISSPNAPRPTGTIKGGDLQALLMALNAGGQGAGFRLPTLGRG